MIQPQALTRLRLLVDSVRMPLVAGAPDREVAPLQPGQAIDARVEKESRAGYIVSVLSRTYEFKLPEGIRPGDWLRLVYIKDEPRPTFALMRTGRSAAATDTTLSGAGRLLATLRELPAGEISEGELNSSTPVFEAGVPETSRAAPLLREALGLSGLFYEAHQAEWVMGARSTAQLKREPQGQLAPLTNAPPVKSTPEFIENAAVPQSAQPESGTTVAPAAAAGDETSLQPEAASPGSLAHLETYPIIRDQLAALESGNVAWKGQIWPGQWLQWKVAEDAPSQPSHSDAPRSWSTELELTLPNIGRIEARIDLHAGAATLRIVADSDERAALLRDQSQTLVGRMNAAGISVTAVKVDHGTATD